MYPKLNLGPAIREKYVLALDGQRDLTQESVAVQFTREYIMQDDIDFGLAHFQGQFKGVALEEDKVTPEAPDWRISVYDTEAEAANHGWDEETREKVEQYVSNHKAYGISFVKIEPVVKEITKPWPSYNNTHHFKVAALAEELGLLEEALAYEQANRARESVIAALEEKIENRGPKAAEDPGEVVAA